MVDDLHHIINHRFAHRREEISTPGMTVGFFVVGGVFSEGFDQKQQVRGLRQGIANRDAGADMEEGLVGAVDEGGEADCFQVIRVGLVDSVMVLLLV